MRFTNREQAARLLADRLLPYRGQTPLVLALPRGAVPMARTISHVIDGDLDVVLVRKLRAPGQPELAIGAVDEAGTVLKGCYFAEAPPEYVREEVRAQREIIRSRRTLYTRAHPPSDPAGRTVIIVDDGVATGASMLAAIRFVRARGARRIVVAVAVASSQALAAIRREADDVVCLRSTAAFYAVGQFFDDFSEVTDQMVVDALGHAYQVAA